ncbi:MAG: hypothetical protein L6Q57_09875 [Alphaproteobacteria bacterium]|nr:hypothetical protein [Alphaproteobacteria bacterium]
MKTAILTFIMILVALPVWAAGADDFGSRFTGRSPSALEMPSLEQRLQEIAPAAGDTEPAEQMDGAQNMPPQPTPVSKEVTSLPSEDTESNQ